MSTLWFLNFIGALKYISNLTEERQSKHLPGKWGVFHLSGCLNLVSHKNLQNAVKSLQWLDARVRIDDLRGKGTESLWWSWGNGMWLLKPRLWLLVISALVAIPTSCCWWMVVLRLLHLPIDIPDACFGPTAMKPLDQTILLILLIPFFDAGYYD